MDFDPPQCFIPENVFVWDSHTICSMMSPIMHLRSWLLHTQRSIVMIWIETEMFIQQRYSSNTWKCVNLGDFISPYSWFSQIQVDLKSELCFHDKMQADSSCGNFSITILWWVCKMLAAVYLCFIYYWSLMKCKYQKLDKTICMI